MLFSLFLFLYFIVFSTRIGLDDLYEMSRIIYSESLEKERKKERKKRKEETRKKQIKE